jgi:hypothetical protein
VRAFAIALLVLGCGPSAKDVVNQHKGVIEGQASKLQALTADVATRPQLEVDALEIPPGVALHFGLYEEPFNTAVVYPGHLKDPCNGEEVHWFEKGREPNYETRISTLVLDDTRAWLVDPVCLLRTGKGPGGGEAPSKEVVESALRLLPKVKYVMVPRLKFLRPTYDIDSDGKVRSFHSGAIVGDALIYELATAKYLGGITIAATNNDKVEDESSTYGALERDLEKRAREGVQEKLAKLAPGGTPPR